MSRVSVIPNPTPPFASERDRFSITDTNSKEHQNK